MWNGTRSLLHCSPIGLFDPVWWRKRRWRITTATKIKGKIKWMEKNRLSVALSTAKPPHIHSTSIFPMYGMAEKRLVITVAPQKLICPQGSTYPINAVAIVRINSRTPKFHVSVKWYEP